VTMPPETSSRDIDKPPSNLLCCAVVQRYEREEAEIGDVMDKIGHDRPSCECGTVRPLAIKLRLRSAAKNKSGI
jgi:hypothetical protein